MEGDGPTGCMVIPEYVELCQTLQDKVDKLSSSDAVYPMLAKMLAKTQEYLDEALACDSLILATLLHPFFRLKFFTKWFNGKTGAIPIKAEGILRRVYLEYESANPSRGTGNSNEVSAGTGSNTSSQQQSKIFHEDTDDEEEPAVSIDNSLDNYLRMADRMRQKDYNLADPKAGLEWWSVSYQLEFDFNLSSKLIGAFLGS